MPEIRRCALLVAVLIACHRTPPAHRDQDDYVEDVAAFTHRSEAQVRETMRLGAQPLKQEWEAWEKQGAMTPERIKAFYKQTENYIYELGQWHLWSADKRKSDLALVDDLKDKYHAKTVLDFGGGVGLNSIPLARAGLDVTLADLDSTTLRFAAFHAERRGVHLKIWKSDVEPAPPEKTYDAILVLDVLEHLPKDELDHVVDELIRLKHPGTQVIISAPFGRTAQHPMHLDADEHTKQQVARLQTAVGTR